MATRHQQKALMNSFRLHRIVIAGSMACVFVSVVAAVAAASKPGDQPENLALRALGGQARSWEAGVPVIPEHEPFRVNDGSLHTYWTLRAGDLPADIGIEWAEPKEISSLVVRYFDGRMVRGPAIARTQQWARLQYWSQQQWMDIKADVVGQETSSVRYAFSPIHTTRVRLLFSEPPDPESRRTPDELGIYVRELEVYGAVPFQVVKGTPRLVQLHRDGGHYNEWGSDNPYDIAGPLVIEPKATAVLTDRLLPTLIVSESRWAQVPCRVDRTAPDRIDLSNGFLKLELSAQGTFRENRLTNLVTGESVSTHESVAFYLRTSSGEVTPSEFKLEGIDSSASDAEAARLDVDLSSPAIGLTVHYDLKRADHFYHKWLTVKNKSGSPLQVLDVTVSSLRLPRLVNLMAGPELTYPIYRMAKGGLFECLEAVYWDHTGDALTYYPGASIAPGLSFESEKAVLGVYRNRGEQVERFDAGVRDWVIEYHARVSPLAPEWPDIYLEGWSAKIGMEELLANPRWAERFFATAQKMGVRYMDSYDPTDLALLMPADLLKRWVELADRYQIGTGWWNDFGSGYGWGFMAPYYQPYLCKLSPEAEHYFKEMVELTRTYRLRGFHWADFWTVWPCDNPNHGHLPGIYSIYAQGKRMVQFSRQLHEASPGLMLGADSGLDNPQYGRYADSRHHGGGYDAEPAVSPDLHLDRLYANMNRDYLYGLAHETLLRPWFRLLNCVNHFGMETHHHDSAGYRYALLSAIALAPQLTFDDAPDDFSDQDLRFTRYWEEWARAHRDFLKEGDKLFDRSYHFEDTERGGDQTLAGFAHIRKDRGYLFLINPDVIDQVADLGLDLDAAPDQKFSVEQIYPRRFTLEGTASGAYVEHGQLRVTVPAKQVRILDIEPLAAGQKLENAQPEDAGLESGRRYLGQWKVEKDSSDSATIGSSFEFPEGQKKCLAASAPESDWSKEPWNFPKAYLLLLLEDETKQLNDLWLPDGLPITVSVNGAPKAVHAFKTGRRQEQGLTRCYFVALSEETKPGAANRVEVTLPVRRGLTFSGAYLDLPDQVPYGNVHPGR
jgi:hypothetical protein